MNWGEIAQSEAGTWLHHPGELGNKSEALQETSKNIHDDTQWNPDIKMRRHSWMQGTLLIFRLLLTSTSSNFVLIIHPFASIIHILVQLELPITR
jgi:hypothetical protein